MRAEERHAAVAYAYAWWMTGDEAAATAALRAGLASPEPTEHDDDARLAALMRGVRRHLGDLRPMPASSEVALLHDGFGVPLAAAAELSGVESDAAGYALAQGRLEALVETVRENFAHADRLAGLSVGEPDALAHAADCSSCRRALTLIERGRTELRQMAPVSAPPGLIAALVAEAAPAAPEGRPPADTDRGDAPDEAAAPEPDHTAEADQPAAEADQPAAEADAAAPAPPETPAPPPPAPPRPAPRPPAPVPPPPERVPMGAGRRGLLAVLAGAGVLITGVLLMMMLSGGPSDDETPVAGAPTERPTAAQTTAPEPTPSPTPRATKSPFDPPGKEFAVDDIGLVLSGKEAMAPAGVTVAPQEPLRLVVDYVNATKGVQLRAVWRVDGEPYDRLSAVVSARASRHVWGLAVPPEGLPAGEHEITVMAEGSPVGTVEFTVSPAT